MEEDVFLSPCCFVSQHRVIDFQLPLFVNGLQHHSYVEMQQAFRRLLFVYKCTIYKTVECLFLSLKDFAPNRITTMPTTYQIFESIGQLATVVSATDAKYCDILPEGQDTRRCIPIGCFVFRKI